MKGFLKKLVTRVAKGQGGFTLIEMIVVVGIIAVLAAVIVPNIGKFIGSGEDGAMDAERESVQTAMNAMMADVSITSVDPSATGPATQDWSAEPKGTNVVALGNATDPYLQDASTVYLYCWDSKGQILDGAAGQSKDPAFAC